MTDPNRCPQCGRTDVYPTATANRVRCWGLNGCGREWDQPADIRASLQGDTDRNLISREEANAIWLTIYPKSDDGSPFPAP